MYVLQVKSKCQKILEDENRLHRRIHGFSDQFSFKVRGLKKKEMDGFWGGGQTREMNKEDGRKWKLKWDESKIESIHKNSDRERKKFGGIEWKNSQEDIRS